MNQPANQNPYDFILEDNKPRKSPLAGGGKKDRILIVVGGGIGLLAIFGILAAVLLSSGGGTSEDILSVAQKQTELIRISSIGEKKARSTTALNFAITAGATLQTDQTTTLAQLKKAHGKSDAKTLGLGRNSKTDALLTSAEQNNQFDDVFTNQMKLELQDYRAALQKLYKETTGTKNKALIKAQYDHATTLLGAQ